MSGGSKTQTQTTSNEPYKAAQPLLDKGMGDALAAYNKGTLVQPNDMSTVVPYDQQTTQAMGGLQALGQANTGGNGLSGAFQGIIDNGGYNSQQMDALSGIQNTANSTYDMNANPGFAGVLKQAQDAATSSVNGMASGLGRYGSGTHQGVMGKTVGDLTDRMVSSDFNNWLGRRDSAQQQLFNAGQQGQDNLSSAYSGAQSAYDPMMQVGAMNEDLAGRQLNDQLRIAQEKQNMPLANIQALLAAAAGGGSYGTQTSKAQVPGSGLSNIIGGGLGLASLFGG